MLHINHVNMKPYAFISNVIYYGDGINMYNGIYEHKTAIIEQAYVINRN